MAINPLETELETEQRVSPVSWDGWRSLGLAMVEQALKYGHGARPSEMRRGNITARVNISNRAGATENIPEQFLILAPLQSPGVGEM